MPWLVVPPVVLCVLCWLSAAVHWIASLRHLSGRMTVGAMLVRGIEAFRQENFDERGRMFQRRFLWSVLGFVLAGALAAVAGILSS
jgi:hypothetical protein